MKQHRTRRAIKNTIIPLQYYNDFLDFVWFITFIVVYRRYFLLSIGGDIICISTFRDPY